MAVAAATKERRRSNKYERLTAVVVVVELVEDGRDRVGVLHLSVEGVQGLVGLLAPVDHACRRRTPHTQPTTPDTKKRALGHYTCVGDLVERAIEGSSTAHLLLVHLRAHVLSSFGDRPGRVDVVYTGRAEREKVS